MNNSTDIIIVGAGPSGTAAAMISAQAGKRVVLIERGDFSGCKNMFGGAIYTAPTKEIYPEFWKTAPVERGIIRHSYALLGEHDGTTISYDKQSSGESYEAYSVTRAKWDRWCAQKAEEAGAVLVKETLVKEILKDGNRVIGVKTDTGEEFLSKIVIIADGVNSILAKQLGFRKDIKPENVALSIKEVLSLPENVIEERFNLSNKTGCTYTIIGGPMTGITGMGFLYTGTNTVSIGVGVSLDDLQKNFLKPYDLLNELKKHPILSPLIKDSTLKEYSAHLIPEGGFKTIPKLYGHGVMITGDAAMLVNNVHWEGTNLAMFSGKYAAETAIEALEKNDFSENTLALYEKKLNNSFILKDMKTYEDVVPTIEKNAEAFLGYYPQKINEFMDMFTTVDGVAKKAKYTDFISSVFKEKPLPSLIKDGIKLVKLAAGVFVK